jgi:hypothetical protein
MADETELTPAEQAAQDAHTATRADEQSWASKVEERLVALEDKTGLTKANEKAAEADNTKED